MLRELSSTISEGTVTPDYCTNATFLSSPALPNLNHENKYTFADDTTKFPLTSHSTIRKLWFPFLLAHKHALANICWPEVFLTTFSSTKYFVPLLIMPFWIRNTVPAYRPLFTRSRILPTSSIFRVLSFERTFIGSADFWTSSPEVCVWKFPWKRFQIYCFHHR